ncbi:MAG: hypothetical protein PUP93_22970 [Rhizonema sp. NSF051]|nr:hypothetical protein [Rhizonema sp. NSF051]
MQPKVLFLNLVKNVEQDTRISSKVLNNGVKVWFKMPTIWFKNMFSQKLSDKAIA